MAKLCKRARVTGKVQGVFFRATTQQQANQLQVTGYAKNLADGSVEVLAIGEKNNVLALLEWLHTGSPGSDVQQVEVYDLDMADAQRFEVL